MDNKENKAAADKSKATITKSVKKSTKKTKSVKDKKTKAKRFA